MNFVRIPAVLVFSLLLVFNTPGYAQERTHRGLAVSLKLAAGIGYLKVGDLNSHIGSFDEYMSDRLAFYDGGKMRGIGHTVPDLEGEIRLELNSRFSLALGCGYLSGSNKSDFQTAGVFPLSLVDGSMSLSEFVLEPRIRAFPLKLGLCYSLPLASGVELIVNGGMGIYISKASLVKVHEIHSLAEPTIPEEPVISNRYDVRGNGLGLHGGVGLEYRLARGLFLALDCRGRYAKVGKLSGTRVYWNSWNQTQGEETGVLYVGARDMTAEGYGANCPDLAVSPSLNMKRAALDFSGISVTMGIRMRLF